LEKSSGKEDIITLGSEINKKTDENKNE